MTAPSRPASSHPTMVVKLASHSEAGRWPTRDRRFFMHASQSSSSASPPCWHDSSRCGLACRYPFLRRHASTSSGADVGAGIIAYTSHDHLDTHYVADRIRVVGRAYKRTSSHRGWTAWAEEAACSANHARYAETLYSTSTVAAFAEFACHDLGFVDREHLAVVELEHGIFDNERPHLVAQSIVMQVALDIAFGLDVVGERLGNRLVKLLQHLHRQDGVNVPRLDQLV